MPNSPTGLDKPQQPGDPFAQGYFKPPKPMDLTQSQEAQFPPQKLAPAQDTAEPRQAPLKYGDAKPGAAPNYGIGPEVAMSYEAGRQAQVYETAKQAVLQAKRKGRKPGSRNKAKPPVWVPFFSLGSWALCWKHK